jgi:hypothetical protein
MIVNLIRNIMSLVSLIVALVILALLYWGTNSIPAFTGTFRAIFSWLWVALAVILIVVWLLGVFGLANGEHINLRLT